jgi:ribosomal protein S18 acetylase RimI-like enzyme
MLALFNILGALATSRFSNEFPGLTLFDSGVNTSYENYAMLSMCQSSDPHGEAENFSRRKLKDAIEFGLEFFSRAASPHIWPLFGWVPDDVCSLLERAQLRRDEDFYAMTADTSLSVAGETRFDTAAEYPLRDMERVREWASSAWYAFDSDDTAPEEYISYALNMASCGEISLMLLRSASAGGAPPLAAATGMLCVSGDSGGIYNVATLPEYRRRGLAMIVVRELIRAAHDAGVDQVSLLATPVGRPLYLRCGFRDVGRVKIFVSSTD